MSHSSMSIRKRCHFWLNYLEKIRGIEDPQLRRFERRLAGAALRDIREQVGADAFEVMCRAWARDRH